MLIPSKDSAIYLTVDKCGRFVLPGCLRAAMGIHTGEQIVITPTNHGYLLTPAKHRCCLCGGDSDLSVLPLDNGEKAICSACMKRICAHSKE